MGVNCAEVWREESEYLDGELDERQRLEFESHVEACPRCTAVLAGTRNIIRLYGDERMLAVPATLHSGVRRLVSASMERRRGSAWGLILSFAVAGAMAMLFITANPHQAGAEASLSPMSQTAVSALPPLVEVGERGRLFHAQGCSLIHGHAEAVPVEAALGKGMAPCARCLGEYLPHPLSGHDEMESAANLEQGSW